MCVCVCMSVCCTYLSDLSNRGRKINVFSGIKMV